MLGCGLGKMVKLYLFEMTVRVKGLEIFSDFFLFFVGGERETG